MYWFVHKDTYSSKLWVENTIIYELTVEKGGTF